MDFALSDEQEEFRETLRRFLDAKSPSAEVRRWMESPEGYDPALWKQMAEELGLQGLHLPDEMGGQGFGFLELGIVFEELGRALLCAPYFSTVALAAGAIRNAGNDEQQKLLLPAIASGECIATLAPATLEPAFVAEPEGDAVRISGSASPVGDGHCADLLVVAARERSGGGTVLATVHADTRGVARVPLETLDLTRRQARIELDGALGERLGDPGDASAALQRTLDQAAALLAAESVGGADRCLADAVAYAKQRVQFARPIGGFQAIKHKCAEVLLELENARAAARWATYVAEADPSALGQAASIAKAVCGDAYLCAARESIQIHGGIGFTWEADPHLYYKRAKTNQILLGDPAHHRARLMRQLGI